MTGNIIDLLLFFGTMGAVLVVVDFVADKGAEVRERRRRNRRRRARRPAAIIGLALAAALAISSPAWACGSSPRPPAKPCAPVTTTTIPPAPVAVPAQPAPPVVVVPAQPAPAPTVVTVIEVLPYSQLTSDYVHHEPHFTIYRFQADTVGASPRLAASWWRWSVKLHHYVSLDKTTGYALSGVAPIFLSGPIRVPKGESIKVRTLAPISNTIVRIG